MKRLFLSTALFLFVAATSFGVINTLQETSSEGTTIVENKTKSGKTKIQVAILLDTSSSMDGLINQAKSRLWNIINTLTTLKYNGETPQIEIALYEYGNSGLSSKDDYIRRVTPLTTDLDLISEKLFGLSTNGGLEYCGTVIDRATRELEWGNDDADMKLIYIAGNEPFTQGEIPYTKAIKRALDKNIFINTIHCGDQQSGIYGEWDKGAAIGKGKFFNIDQNAQLRHIDTPYDAKIADYNVKLNDTYIAYGASGETYKMNQAKQDVNAKKLSSSVFAERAISKSNAVYSNSSWDMVDQAKNDKDFVSKISKKELPEELKDKSTDEIQNYISTKAKERETIQKEIANLAQLRQAYIDEKMKAESDGGDDLGDAITSSILAMAKVKGYELDK